MRRLLSLLAALALAWPVIPQEVIIARRRASAAFTYPAYVQSVWCHNSGSTSYSCPAITPAAGNTLVVVQANYNQGTPPTPSGGSLTYNLKVSGVSSITGYNIFLWVVDGSGISNTAYTVSFTGGGASFNEGFVIELSHCTATGCFDQGGYHESATSTNTSVSTSGATTHANELVMGFFTGATSYPTVGSGFTFRVENSSNNLDFVEDEQVSSTGTQTATFVNASQAHAEVVATFQ